MKKILNLFKQSSGSVKTTEKTKLAGSFVMKQNHKDPKDKLDYLHFVDHDNTLYRVTGIKKMPGLTEKPKIKVERPVKVYCIIEEEGDQMPRMIVRNVVY